MSKFEKIIEDELRKRKDLLCPICDGVLEKRDNEYHCIGVYVSPYGMIKNSCGYIRINVKK